MRLAARSVVDQTRLTLSTLRDRVLLVWSLYIFLTPIYLWRSGLPQPGDVMIILLAPMALSRWNGRMTRYTFAPIRALLVFTVYVIAINVTWSVVLGAWSLSLKHGFGLSPLFYLYNTLIFVVVIVLHRLYGSRLLDLSTKIILATLLTQAVIAMLLVTDTRRATVFFNNPNQLGYYALVSASLLMILQRRQYATTIQVAVGSLAATYLALISASKAALGGIVLLVIAGSFARLRTMLLVAGAFGLLLLIAGPMLDALTGAISRIENDESLAFAEERGYDRILEHPEYWVLGSGEGAYTRFEETTAIGSHEIHSSIGTLFFSYGIVGTVMFGAFLWLVLRRTGLRMWLLVMPSLAYGLTHQGLRFTLFWVLLAVVVVLREEAMAPTHRANVQ